MRGRFEGKMENLTNRYMEVARYTESWWRVRTTHRYLPYHDCIVSFGYERGMPRTEREASRDGSRGK